jgi:tetratricopeptide (TPR) repeat protein
MPSRQRALVVVAGAALLAAAAVLAITLATRQTPAQPKALSGAPGVPKLLPTPAAAAIRAAYRSWPRGSLDAMLTLGREDPRDPVVQFYLGIALLWSGYGSDAVAPLEAAKRLGRDTLWEVQADNLLHPQYFTNDPVFTPLGSNALLRRGAVLQAEGHRHSAERLYLEAAAQEPGNDEAQVAAAVGRFDKGDLAASFSRLGPLTRRFPHSQTVRFYLGLLLAWTGQRDPAVAQFEQAVALGKGTRLGTSAREFLARLASLGTATRRK